MGQTLVHVLFDALAWAAAGAAAWWLTRIKHIEFPPSPATLPYVAAVLLGAGIGAVVFGAANLWLSGQSGLGRSIEGALAGGILAVELYKRCAGIGRAPARALRCRSRSALRSAVSAAFSPDSMISPRAHRRHGRGVTTSAMVSRAIRCSSMKAPRCWERRCSMWVRSCGTTRS